VQQQHPEVRRDRVKTGRVHDPGAGVQGDLVRRVVAVPHEQHLTGEVGVGGAGLGAGLDERQAVLDVRPYRRGHRDGRLGQRPERGRIGGVGDDQRPAHPELVAQRLQLRQGPTRQGDPRRAALRS
jgi:hypothetical protein